MADEEFNSSAVDDVTNSNEMIIDADDQPILEDEALSKDGYDPSHKGPATKRSCTDVICCLVFIIFIAGLVAIAYFAYVNGDPRLLIYPEDSNGNLCGYGSFADKKYLFFFDLVLCARMGPGVFVNGCPTPQVCVAECPQRNYVFLESKIDQDKSKLFCKNGVDTSAKRVEELVYNDDCAAYYMESEQIINRCLPKFITDLGNKVVEITGSDHKNYSLTDADNNTITGDELDDGTLTVETFLKAKEYGEKIVADVVASWWMILIGLCVAMLISLIWIMLMRILAGIMVWITILAFVVLWLFLTVICFYMWNDVKGKDEQLTLYLVTELTFEKESLFLAGGIIFGIIFLIVFLLLLFLCSRIRIAIALIEQGSRAVGSMWSTLFWPFIPFILQVGVVAFWCATATFLASIGREPDPEDNNITFANGSLNIDKIEKESSNLIIDYLDCNATENKFCGYIKYGKGDFTVYLQLYNLFMLFWLVNFMAALGQLTLSGAFASWYWAFRKPEDLPTFPLAGAFYRCFRYHLGSLAFGSLIIAIVQIIRTILEYLDSKLKGSENAVAKFFLKCLKCCFWCLEKVLKFLTKNAYIMMAVYGKNFCSSAKRAFELIVRNVVRVFVLDKVTDFLLFICKLVVVGLTGVAAYFFFDGRIDYLSEYKPELNFYIVPIVIVILGAYIIADIFFSVYEMAVDTLFLCFCEDIERNDGSPEKPYFMGKDLMQILGKKNLQPKQ